MSSVNKTESSRHEQQSEICFYTTIQSFCESLLSANFVTNKEKLSFLREKKSTNGWLRDRNNNIRHYDTDEKTVIPLKLMISDVMWLSMRSQTCNYSDNTLENRTSLKKNVILLTECESALINKELIILLSVFSQSSFFNSYSTHFQLIRRGKYTTISRAKDNLQMYYSWVSIAKSSMAQK